jgi:uncharacterized protein
MKKITLILALFFVSGVVAQQNPADATATKEDIQRYLEVTHSREMVKQISDVMAKSIRDITHDRIAKEHCALPADADERMNKKTDEMLKNMPIDEMFDVMISVYQKHWTKRDVDNLVAFYSTPTGKKVLAEMPQTMAESMQVMRPVMLKHIDSMKQNADQQLAELEKEYKVGQAKKAQPVSN